MRKRIPLSMLAVGLLTLGAVAPTMAQTNVDTSLLDAVKTAFDSTNAVTSVTVNSQSTSGAAQSDANAPSRTIIQSDQIAANGSGWDVSGSLTTSSTGGQNGASETTLEYIEVNGVTYVRFTAIPEQMTQMGLPTEWVDVSTLGRIPGVSVNADGSISVAALDVLELPLDTSSVTAISELPAETIDGVNMRVFQLTLDASALEASDAAGLLDVNVGGGFGGGRSGNGQQLPDGQAPQDMNGQQPPQGQPGNGQQPPGGQPPADANGQQPPQGQTGNGQPPGGFQMQPLSAENMQVSVTVWVGDDGLVHRVSSNVAAAPASDAATSGPMASGFNVTTVSDFSQFNVPVQISAPADAAA